MSATFTPAFEQIARFDHPDLIRQYASKNGIDPNEAAKHFVELKKFLYLCATSDLPCAPSKALDNIWHEFILHTRDYQDFCLWFLGTFIHHQPSDRVEVESYARTRALAAEVFGNLDNELWPQVSTVSVSCGDGSCGNCNSVSLTCCDSSCDSSCHAISKPSCDGSYAGSGCRASTSGD
jgi:hypothetical protein